LHRDCDVLDWIADTTVIIGVLIVIIAFKLRRQRRSTNARSMRA